MSYSLLTKAHLVCTLKNNLLLSFPRGRSLAIHSSAPNETVIYSIQSDKYIGRYILETSDYKVIAGSNTTYGNQDGSLLSSLFHNAGKMVIQNANDLNPIFFLADAVFQKISLVVSRRTVNTNYQFCLIEFFSGGNKD